MPDHVNKAKRDFLKSAGVGTLAGTAVLSAAGSGFSLRQAVAQGADSGIDPNSVLAKVIRERKLRIGYAQTLPWFQLDPKKNALTGIYYDTCIQLCKEMEVEPVFVETSFGNATLELRQGNFDLFGSSLSYTVARAMTANYIGPLWRKGVVAVTNRERADRFKSVAELNKPEITFSVTAGTREESVIKFMFPKAKLITSQGQWMMGAEPVRTGRADIWLSGDSDAQAFARRNEWVHIINPEAPIDRRPNTWAIRYGDPTWKFYLDMWADATVSSGFMEERFKFHTEQT